MDDEIDSLEISQGVCKLVRISKRNVYDAINDTNHGLIGSGAPQTINVCLVKFGTLFRRADFNQFLVKPITSRSRNLNFLNIINKLDE